MNLWSSYGELGYVVKNDNCLMTLVNTNIIMIRFTVVERDFINYLQYIVPNRSVVSAVLHDILPKFF
jgi:hypothetical protein